MGLQAACAKIQDLVEGIAPPLDSTERFECLHTPEGLGLSLDDLEVAGRPRQFEVRQTGLPQDDGEAVNRDLRLRVQVVVRVAYPSPEHSDQVRLGRIISADAGEIVKTLAWPNTWDYAATGIDALVLANLQPSMDRRQADVVLSVPVIIIYHED